MKNSLVIFIVIFFSCKNDAPVITTHPRHFKMQFYCDAYSPALKLKSSWGKEKNIYSLQLDNHSPTWVNDVIINHTSSIKRLQDVNYSTSTSDGKKINGDVYVCDSLSIGGVVFNNVLLYHIDDGKKQANGVIGENIVSIGVLKVDFENNIATFASSIDSIDGMRDAKNIPTDFHDNVFNIELAFSNGIKKKFAVDFGFNGNAVLPVNDFNDIASGNIYNDSASFATPGGSQNVNRRMSHEKIFLAGDSSHIFFSTNEKITESLLGWGFFKQFEFVILDYPNKRMYVSKFKKKYS